MKIAIVGGGSGSQLVGLILSYKIEDAHIDCYAEDTPQLGVGESTTGSYLATIAVHGGVNIEEFLNEVQLITKYGNWFKFGKKDFHYTFDIAFNSHLLHQNEPLGKEFKGGNFGFSPFSQAMINKEGSKATWQSPSVHLNYVPVFNYFKKILKERGVNFIERRADIYDLAKRYDYVFDCTGQRTNDTDYSKLLVNNSALFVNMPTTHQRRPYTTSHTMNSGWLWDIDHEFTSSYGYVYCDKYISDEDAKLELQEKIGRNVEGRIIRFKSSRRDIHWEDNIIHIGNSDIFIEPLEATSLQMIQEQIINASDIIRYKEKGNIVELFNTYADRFYDLIKDFVFLHLCYNDKLDTPYWNDYNKRRELLPNGRAKNILDYYRKNDTHVTYALYLLGPNNPYDVEGWYSIFRGLNV